MQMIILPSGHAGTQVNDPCPLGDLFIKYAESKEYEEYISSFYYPFFFYIPMNKYNHLIKQIPHH